MKFPFNKKKPPAGATTPSTPTKYERLPLFAIILYGLAGGCLILYIVMTQSVAFADWFNQGIGAGVRSVLSLLTSWIPFSTGEAVILLLPLALFLLLKIDKQTIQSVIFYYAMPVASFLPSFLLRYNPEAVEARVAGGYMVVLSTLACVATIPIWTLLLELI